MTRLHKNTFGLLAVLLAQGLLVSCQPTVRVEAPKDPITINLNVKLDADVRVRLEEQAEEDIESKPDIF
ncbi:YnbE family lipoprotein [Fodinicurvata fenggangensis]|uniref:YnbE family lipoprotein n=1 Tax=Fodinicurvata fenggangensis TaxID=1121830 RepID=UPI001FE033D7|nr:YnbE family lipoprotein [Fodinicurvata fenggangensis]